MEWWTQPSDPRWWGSLVASFAVSAFVTWLSILYARRRALLDLPGRRRSHSVPTPRGGGIGIVAAAIVACAWLYASTADVGLLRAAVAIMLVAAAGWLDDHYNLGVMPRLVVHFFAGVVLLSWTMHLPPHSPTAWFGATILLIGCVWSINLHNFMDGINGLLAIQALFVLLAFAVLRNGPTLLFVLWAAAVFGFLPFNFPRARVFMGDIGSGALGLMIAAGTLWLDIAPGKDWAYGLIVTSAFVTDATCTLLSRMLSGRRWYSAHREHLYQWMTRTGMSHARVVAWYMGWNLLVVVPVLCLANRGDTAGSGFFRAIAVYALATLVWFIGKRWCLHKVKNTIKQKV